MDVLCVAGARPNFMKVSALIGPLKECGIDTKLVHTGQHYDENMSGVFFKELGLPEPDAYLGVGSGGYSEQVGRVVLALVERLKKERPDLMVVVGDANSTLGAAIAGAVCNVKVAHVEAGLRSFNNQMGEEINRLATDRLSEILFTSEESANKNLEKEFNGKKEVHFVGNVMIDTLLKNLEKAKDSRILDGLGLEKKGYAIFTMHRPATVDFKENFEELIGAAIEVSKNVRVVWPVHPRARKMMKAFGVDDKSWNGKRLLATEPLGYLDFLKLMKECRFVMTDSGGVQEETTILGVPCITMRNETERPVTVELGTNTIAGTAKDSIIRECRKVLAGDVKKPKEIPKWDGKAGERIAEIIAGRADERGKRRHAGRKG